tara:strand:- start:106 stop:273 length:168 start_codon:yes stop_codon:yes gene_type:complete
MICGLVFQEWFGSDSGIDFINTISYRTPIITKPREAKRHKDKKGRLRDGNDWTLI